MNVYDHIAGNNRRTFGILLAFPAALFVTVFLFSLLIVKTEVLRLYDLGIQKTDAVGQALELTLLVYPWIVLVAFIWIAFSYYMGGAMILRIAHARPVTFEEDRDLYRLVENTAIMAGLPTPKIYLIADESMNAFATGRNPEEGVVALTDGIVKKLDKAELQAVIAHELAHIGNRDTRLMLIVVAGIGCFIFFGGLLCRMAFHSGHGRRSKDSGNSALVLFAIGIVCLLFGYIVAPILRFALSRRREYQADATAVKITRDPQALSRALTKIAFDPRVEVLDSSPLVGNMCIENPAESGFSFTGKLYSTHPSIDDRLIALENMMGKDTASQPAGKAVW
jgi:heat shock protein HtpX